MNMFWSDEKIPNTKNLPYLNSYSNQFEIEIDNNNT